jgi:hypothetical protein
MLAAIGARFALQGQFISAERYDGGHINDTYFATYREDGVVRRYVHQRINTRVFPNAVEVNENIARVTRHIREKFQACGEADIERRVLQLVPTVDGADLHVSDEGEYWRTYTFVERTVPRMRVQNRTDAFAAARAFGEFSAALADLPAESLHETIRAFHDTPARLQALERAIEKDVCNRAATAKDEIAAALRLRHLAPALFDVAKAAKLPLRPTHNDSKITNVLFDERSGEAVCIVDLDTVMPGLTLYDVGELVRTASTLAAEDEPDPQKVAIDADLFEAVASGFLNGAGGLCTREERDAFVTAGKVLAFENGIRFLADHLNGDTYFRVHRPNHNLDRARAQFAIVASLEKQEEDLRRRVDSVTPAA